MGLVKSVLIGVGVFLLMFLVAALAGAALGTLELFLMLVIAAAIPMVMAARGRRVRA